MRKQTEQEKINDCDAPSYFLQSSSVQIKDECILISCLRFFNDTIAFESLQSLFFPIYDQGKLFPQNLFFNIKIGSTGDSYKVIPPSRNRKNGQITIAQIVVANNYRRLTPTADAISAIRSRTPNKYLFSSFFLLSDGYFITVNNIFMYENVRFGLYGALSFFCYLIHTNLADLFCTLRRLLRFEPKN